MKRQHLFVAITLTVAAVGPTHTQTRPPNPCANAEHHQFDFWIGDWVVTTPDGKIAGHNHVESIANGCGLEENWTGGGGGSGRSLNTYVAADEQWHQFWVGAGGSVRRARSPARHDAPRRDEPSELYEQSGRRGAAVLRDDPRWRQELADGV
jgi:hypothetical protein